MPNYSDLTRRDQVLIRLREAEGAWVDGTELANEVVGGSEGLKRLRELRKPEHGNWNITMRQKPGSDQFQYRIDPEHRKIGEAFEAGKAVTFPDVVGLGIPSPDPKPDYWSGVPKPPEPVRPEPAETYDYRQEPPAKKSGSKLGRTEDGTWVVVHDNVPDEMPDMPLEQIQAPGQTSMDVPVAPLKKFREFPKGLDLGLHRPCPMCGGYRKPIYETDPVSGAVLKFMVGAKGALKPHVIAYEDFCRDPRKGHGNEPCERCNGFGIIPA
jgi:hypothetical protein